MNEAKTDSSPQNIIITANGHPHDLLEGSSIATLLDSFGVRAERVVVQLDGMIIPRSDYATTALRQGSHLEIVTMVGGG